MPSHLIDYGALSPFERMAGLLVTLTLAHAALWLASGRPTWIPEALMRDVRRMIAVINTATFATAFAFFGGSHGLPALAFAAVIGMTVSLLALATHLHVRAGTDPAAPSILGRTLWPETLVLFATGSGACFVSATVILMVWQGNSANVRFPLSTVFAPRSTFDARIMVTGVRKVVRPGLPTPFQASSGQVNFSCEEIETASVVWALPADALLQGTPTAQWAHVTNARSHAVSAHRDDQLVRADGVIQGLDRQRLGIIANCPGEGRGELVLSGRYVTNTRIQKAFTSELAARVDTIARTAHVTLPSKADVDLTKLTFIFNDAATDREVDRAVLDLTEPKERTKRSTYGHFEVGAATDEVLIELLQP